MKARILLPCLVLGMLGGPGVVAEALEKQGPPPQGALDDPKPQAIERFAKTRRMLLDKGLPFEPNLLLRKDWRQHLRTRLEAMPEMQIDRRLSPNEVKGVILARRLVISSRLRIDEDTFILADSLAFVGEDSDAVIYAPGKSLTLRVLNGVIHGRTTRPLAQSKRARSRITIITGAMSDAEKKIVGNLAQNPFRVASTMVQLDDPNLNKDGMSPPAASDGHTPPPAAKGSTGGAGNPGDCSAGGTGGEGEMGGTGARGEDATTGNPGQDGGNAGNIDLDYSYEGWARYHSLSARGGRGADGGAGGTGGQGGEGGEGGRGGNAVFCGYPANGGRSGDGGRAGSGGHGKTGGPGGRGGNGGSIAVKTCYSYTISTSNQGGQGGSGGTAGHAGPSGTPGVPGSGGSGTFGAQSGAIGSGGPHGNSGQVGYPGTNGGNGDNGPDPTISNPETCPSGGGGGTGGTEDQCDPYGTEAAQCAYQGGEFNRDPQICTCEFNNGGGEGGAATEHVVASRLELTWSRMCDDWGCWWAARGPDPFTRSALATGGRSSIWQSLKTLIAPPRRIRLKP